MDTSYLKLLAGSRLTNHMGLKMDEGMEYRYGKNYLHLDIPARPVAEEIKRNQHVFLEAAATVDIKGRSFIEVEPNARLFEFGQAQGTVRIHPDSGEVRLGIWFTAHKAFDVSELDFLVRIYMPA